MDDLSFLVQETLRVHELRQLGEWEEEDGEEVWSQWLRPLLLHHLFQ